MGGANGRQRAPDELRLLEIVPDPLEYPPGSALVRWGRTHVLCAVSVEERLPSWKVGSATGWLTAEYALLPAATHTRTERDRNRLRPDGRTQEISRLLGRSLRAVVDLAALGPRTLHVDCDVLQADGGTRCAAITGAQVALALALRRLTERRQLPRSPLLRRIAAVSAGIVDGQPLLDLDYADDHRAEVDVNFVLTDAGELVELQGTGEKRPFTFAELDALILLVRGALPQLGAAQEQALARATRT
ncbi:MAG: ribonuclease PH [Myxococcota bacterium]|jgi:ribonuclease PH|nr:ribonuclease PH [Myxococcota bacterium]